MPTTASVYYNRIRVDYPQAGKDNDSQGFRDNFRNIFNAFSATNADIELLQLNSVTLGGNNDFGYNTIKKATLQSCVTKVIDYSVSPGNGNTNVNFTEGNYQKYSLNSGTTTFFIINWPASGLAEMTLSVKPNTTFSTVIDFGGTYKPIGNTTIPLTTTTTSTHFFDLWSDDSGTTYYIQQKGL